MLATANHTTTPRSTAFGLLTLRVVVATIFIMHGGQKLFVYGFEGTSQFMASTGLPLPELSAAAAIAAELLGGLALLFGAFTRWVTPPLAFTMLVAAVTVHLKGGFFLPSGIEYTLILFAASIALALTGPGALAVDNLRHRNRLAAVEDNVPRTGVQHVEAA
ncbi:MAG: DoxX family protein [Planctomycetota bacterium]